MKTQWTTSHDSGQRKTPRTVSRLLTAATAIAFVVPGLEHVLACERDGGLGELEQRTSVLVSGHLPRPQLPLYELRPPRAPRVPVRVGSGHAGCPEFVGTWVKGQ